MEIWLKNGSKKFMFPVNPSSIEIQSTQANSTVNINGIGEVNLIGKRNLRTTSISSFFPAHIYDFLLCKPYKDPYTYCKALEAWKRDGDILDFSITGTPIAWPCTIESFTYGEQDGSEDVYFTLDIKEYRKLKVNAVASANTSKVPVDKTTKKVTGVVKDRTTKKVSTFTYTVKKNDTLALIAKKETGSSANWRAIYNTNKKIIGSNPNKIRVGQKLVIKT